MCNDHQSLDTYQDMQDYRERYRDNQPPEHTILFDNQTIADIFPRMKWDGKSDAEREALASVLWYYTQAAQNEAEEAYPEILQHYGENAPNDPTKNIYYKFYGAGRGDLAQLVAYRDTRNDRIFVGSSKWALWSSFKVNTKSKNIYTEISLQEVLERIKDEKDLQEERSVQWALHNIHKPFYKDIEDYQGKKGPRGLYVSDELEGLTKEFGGRPSSMARIYDITRSYADGPWILPEGGVQEQPSVRKSSKPKYGTVFKLEAPDDAPGRARQHQELQPGGYSLSFGHLDIGDPEQNARDVRAGEQLLNFDEEQL